MRVLVTGGGTGGHVNPALAIANTIKENIPDAEIAFVGTKRGIENRLVGKEGYKIYHIEIQGLKRKLTLSNIKTAYLTVTSVFSAISSIDQPIISRISLIRDAISINCSFAVFVVI